MNYSIKWGFSQDQFTWLIQGLIYLVASTFVLRSLSRARRESNTVHLKWLIPMAIYTVEEAISYFVQNLYTLFNSSEPNSVELVSDTLDNIGLLAFLWALVVLSRIVRDLPSLVKAPILNGETPEGVWPPAPRR